MGFRGRKSFASRMHDGGVSDGVWTGMELVSFWFRGSSLSKRVV